MKVSSSRPVVIGLTAVCLLIGSSALCPVLAADTSPPTAPAVTDDGDLTSCSTATHAIWTASQDPESGIDHYEYAVGSTSGAADVVGWTPVALATEATVSNLNLLQGRAYYFSVRAVNGDGLSSIGIADGITVDTSNLRIAILSNNATSYPGSLIPRYEKYEVTFEVNGLGQQMVAYNPYKPAISPVGSEYYNNLWGVAVDAVLTSPTGRRITWPCFWYEGTDGWKGWKLRFAPTEIGPWSYRLRAATQYGVLASCQDTFQCGTGQSHGFVEVDSGDRRFFQFTDGKPLYLVGSNLSGSSTPGGVEGAAATAFPTLQQYGANFSRVFYNSVNIEPYNVGTDKCQIQSLNIYSQQRCRGIDSVLDTAHQYGIYLEWVVDDWTHLKDSSSQYIRPGDCSRAAPAADITEFFSQPLSKEIFKRKLRYWLARWGYSTNLLSLDLINEIDTGGSAQVAWHNEMCDYIHSFSGQPHLVSSSNGSGWMSTDHGIDWSSSSIDFVNYHDYAKYSNQWPYLNSPYNLEKLGIDTVWPDPPVRGTCDDNGYPWVDTAVWVDRIARLYHKRCQWNKPLVWSEFGLIYRDCQTPGFPDWDAGYTADASAEHVRAAVWASAFTGCAVSHWKLDYMLGTAPYTPGGNKLWVLGAVSGFLAGENLRGLRQETAYPVADPLNPSPRLRCLVPGTSSPEPRVMVMGLLGGGIAFLYVKNLTSAWATLVDPAIAPISSPQSATVKVAGITPGRYLLENWSTTDTNPATQKAATSSLSVGADGVATIEVNGLVADVAFKLKPEVVQPGLKGQPDGADIQISGAVVTLSWYEMLYVESDDRSWGVRVEMPDMYFDVGCRVDVAGQIRTKDSGERYIEATLVTQCEPPFDRGSIEPISLSCKTLGGGDWYYISSTGAGHVGVHGGSGLNNIGLLVRICGYVSILPLYEGYYYIDDGSGIKDGTVSLRAPYPPLENIGIRVDDASRRFAPGQYLSIMGISSCFRDSGKTHRLLIPRFGDEISF